MNINDTIQFIKEAHKDQLDKTGEEYWKHPMKVMTLLPDDASENMKHAALLHDVLEDTCYLPDDLRERGYNEIIIEMVEDLTRPCSISYEDWIKYLCWDSNIDVLEIKMADISHNIDEERISSCSEELRKEILEMKQKRYLPALEMIKEELDARRQEGRYELGCI